MRYFMLCLCVMFAMAVPTFGQAIPMNGVNSQERIIKLPEDGSKFYISVVGNSADPRYVEVLGWFDSGKLKTLRDSVHFIPVTIDMPVYAERYRKSIKGLPTVRVQDATGVVLFEESGTKLPMSGDGLYSAIANAVSPPEAWLPWRRKHDTQPQPQPTPTPTPTPNPDPTPQPIDNGGVPVIEPVDDLQGLWIAICVVALIVGLVYGQIEKSKKKN